MSKGPGELICSEEGLWTGDVPSCMPKPCGMPLTLANADVEFSSPDGYTLGYGSVANYRCKAGYVSQRKGFLKCDKDGQWRGEVYPCSQVGPWEHVDSLQLYTPLCSTRFHVEVLPYFSTAVSLSTSTPGCTRRPSLVTRDTF